MGDKTDKAKGRVKQAAGDLVDDDELRRSGKDDERAGKAKELIDEVKEKADEVVDRVKERVDDIRNR
ncbi:MAG: CsbD family protein [Microthrixaceae bacterium]